MEIKIGGSPKVRANGEIGKRQSDKAAVSI